MAKNRELSSGTLALPESQEMIVSLAPLRLCASARTLFSVVDGVAPGFLGWRLIPTVNELRESFRPETAIAGGTIARSRVLP